jgi:hypothetical protein
LKKKNVTNAEAMTIGCAVAIVVFLLLYMLFLGYMLVTLPIFLITMLPSVLLGAWLGKYFLKTRTGIWLGAVLGAIPGFWLFSSNFRGILWPGM